MGVFGSPLCVDVSGDCHLMAVGWEDDSFVIYALNFFNAKQA
jgi:hypothetical protein